jgi:hypothetical protein
VVIRVLGCAWLAGCAARECPSPFDPADDFDGDGLSEDQGDCDDQDATRSPDAVELCNGADDDCDGTPDDGVTPPTWYADADGDGFGDPTAATIACEAPADAVADGTDCDDTDGAVHPGAPEACGDGVDQDCDDADAVQTIAGELEAADADGVFTYPTAGLPPAFAVGQADDDAALELAVVGLPYFDGSVDEPADHAGSWQLDPQADFASDNSFEAQSVALPGDVTGDGRADLVLGDPDAILLKVVPGPLADTINLASGSVIDVDVPFGDAAGQTLGSPGDITGDGFPDLMVGAPWTNGDAGRVWVLEGPIDGTVALDEAPMAFLGALSGEHAGTPLLGGFDLDGDGAPDVAIGSPGEDAAPARAYIVLDPPHTTQSLGDADLIVEAAESAFVFQSMAIAADGDVNDDGYDDLAAGNAGDDGTGGVAAVFRGGATFGGNTTKHLRNGDTVIHGPSPGDLAATQLAWVADLDGDGGDDLAVGVASYPYPSGIGAVYVVDTPPTGVLELSDTTDWNARILGPNHEGRFGWGLLSADFDGDGRGDLLVSSSDDDDPPVSDTHLHLFLGSCE